MNSTLFFHSPLEYACLQHYSHCGLMCPFGSFREIDKEVTPVCSGKKKKKDVFCSQCLKSHLSFSRGVYSHPLLTDCEILKSLGQSPSCSVSFRTDLSVHDIVDYSYLISPPREHCQGLHYHLPASSVSSLLTHLQRTLCRQYEDILRF